MKLFKIFYRFNYKINKIFYRKPDYKIPNK